MIVYLEDHGGSLISQDDILRKHGKRGFNKFMKWMIGQTCPIVPKAHIKIPKPTEFVYFYDYQRWANGFPNLD